MPPFWQIDSTPKPTPAAAGPMITGSDAKMFGGTVVNRTPNKVVNSETSSKPDENCIPIFRNAIDMQPISMRALS